MAYGAIADRYVTVDFTGPRYLTLVETESSRWSDYQWNDGKGSYNAYRETIRFDAVSAVSVWCQNLPPGRTVKCRVGPIKALPMLPARLRNPALTVNGERVEFPTELPLGGWLEYEGGSHFAVFGSKGEPLGRHTKGCAAAPARRGKPLRFPLPFRARTLAAREGERVQPGRGVVTDAWRRQIAS